MPEYGAVCWVISSLMNPKFDSKGGYRRAELKSYIHMQICKNLDVDMCGKAIV